MFSLNRIHLLQVQEVAIDSLQAVRKFIAEDSGDAGI
jgi:hypothetical protein